MSTRWFVLVAVVFGVLFIGLADAKAERRPRQQSQPKQQKQQKPPVISTVTLEGTVKAIGTKGFKASASKDTTDNKKMPIKEWLVAPLKDTVWVITGTADVSYLKPGQTVTFKATLNDQGQPDAKISELTLVPAEGNSPGITADDGTGPIRPKDPGIGGVQPAANQIKKVVGKMTSCGETKLVVGAGKEVHAELAESPTVNIALCDPKLMVVGAKVTVHGTALKTKNASYCEADDIKVTLVEPLTGRKKSTGSASLEATTPKDDADKAAGDKVPAEAK